MTGVRWNASLLTRGRAEHPLMEQLMRQQAAGINPSDPHADIVAALKILYQIDPTPITRDTLVEMVPAGLRRDAKARMQQFSMGADPAAFDALINNVTANQYTYEPLRFEAPDAAPAAPAVAAVPDLPAAPAMRSATARMLTEVFPAAATDDDNDDGPQLLTETAEHRRI